MHPRVHSNWHRLRPWAAGDGYAVCGSAFDGDTLLTADDIGRRLAAIDDLGAARQLAENLNGFFGAVARLRDGTLVAIADRVRSVPVHYALHGAELLVSDDAQWIESQIGAAPPGRLVEAEYRLAAFVGGQDTLNPGIKQLTAGEIAGFDLAGEEITARTTRYYRYTHSYNEELTEAEFAEQHDSMLLSIFRRLITVADGRTIVIPLSGGYDSRLAAIMLKRLGYDAVLCFTYGQPGNPEAVLSREVAGRLGLDWAMVPYSNKQWRRWWSVPALQEYLRFAGNLSQVPHIQDWPAVYELTRDGRLPRDSIFVPGMSPDLAAGAWTTHIPEIYAGRQLSDVGFARLILQEHFINWDWTRERVELEAGLCERILSRMGPLGQWPDSASAFESQFTDGKCSKYLVNAVRCYESFGYDWWLPFWDVELLDFWATTPVRFRLGKKHYNDYVARQYMKLTGVSESRAHRTEQQWLPYRVKGCLLGWASRLQWAQRLYFCLKRRWIYANHPLAFYGMVPRELFNRLYTGRETIVSFLALHMLGHIELPVDRPRGVSGQG